MTSLFLCDITIFFPAFFLSDPMDGVKGKTWGPSSLSRDRHPRSPWVFNDGRWSKSAPNLEKSLHHLGAHSNISALQEIGMYHSVMIGGARGNK